MANAAAAAIYASNASTIPVDQDCLDALAVTVPIQSGVAAANSGDTIVVCPGIYTENVTDNGKDLVFQSMVADQATVTAAAGRRSPSVVTAAASTVPCSPGQRASRTPPAAFLEGNDERVENSTFDGDSNATTIFGSGVTFQNNTV